MASTGLLFGDCLRATLEGRNAQQALGYADEWLTFGDLRRRAAAVARDLLARGLEQGDRVIMLSPDKVAFLHVHLGIMLGGGVSLPINFSSTRDEIAYFLENSGARIVFAGRDQMSIVDGLRTQSPRLEHVLTEDWYQSLPPAQDLPPGSFSEDDPALILYTSGTTGQPKGAVHTHRSLACAVSAIAECWAFSEEDVLLNVLPLFHIHGLSFATHVWLLTGGRMLIEDSFHPRRTLESLSQATVFMAVPPFYYSWLERPEFRRRAGQFGKVRLFTCGSAPIRPEVLPELQDILDGPIINRYGMTESHVITSLPLTGPHKVGSVGLPLKGVEMEVGGQEGEAGVVWIRGPNLFREYWDNPEATSQAFDEQGWFDTGDIGRVDEDGFLTLRGRVKDLIIVGGFNVYPPMVERVVNDCPGVKECAVIGLPDAKRGEQVVAVVVPSDSDIDRATIRAYCRDKLVDYQRPTRVEFADELPRNTMGKILKSQLRERLS